MPSVLSIAVASLTLAATSVSAQTPVQPAAPANFNLPHAYAGYSQPEITRCTTTGALKASCVVPAMTAGRYAILAQASATSTAANATQGLSISLNGVPCVTLKPTPFTGKKGVYTKLADTISSFAEVCEGKADDIPEQAFLYAGGIEEVRERAKAMK